VTPAAAFPSLFFLSFQTFTMYKALVLAGAALAVSADNAVTPSVEVGK
jgi:hypothetical protein